MGNYLFTPTEIMEEEPSYSSVTVVYTRNAFSLVEMIDP